MDEKDKDLFEELNSLLEGKKFEEYEKCIINQIIADSSQFLETIKWNRYLPMGAYNERLYCDLYGYDFKNKINIYIEIKTTINRKIILLTVNQFRKTRTLGKIDDIYLLVTFNKEDKCIKYYDLSKMVKSDAVEIGHLITETLDNGKNDLKDFLDGTYDDKIETIGEKDIPNVVKKNDFPAISRFILLIAALFFIIIVWILDFKGCYDLTPERLVLIGMFVATCLIFFIKEIRYKDIYISTINAKDK